MGGGAGVISGEYAQKNAQKKAGKKNNTVW